MKPTLKPMVNARKNIYQTLITALMVSMLGFGCSKPTNDSTNNSTTDNKSHQSQPVANGDLSELFDASQPQKDPFTVSRLSSKSALLGFKDSMSKKLSADAFSCINADLTEDMIINDVQALFKDRLSPKELKDLNVFYESSIGQKFMKFFTQELEVMTGKIKPNERYIKLNEDEQKKMRLYNSSSLGRSMAKVYAGNSIHKILEANLSDKIKSCGVEL